MKPLNLLVLLGPTACGKTRLGVEVAHALGSEIVSVDSRQVYRGLDIGTGKDLHEYRRVQPPVPVHLIDVADPRDVYTVFHYQQDCYSLMAAKADQGPYRDGMPLLMVGGTGLYAEAVLRAFRIANVPEDPTLRDRLMRRDLPELVDELSRTDPEQFARTDVVSKKRVVRALEIVAYARERPVSYSAPPPVSFVPKVFCVRDAVKAIDARIAERLEARLDEGLIAEVERLLADGVSVERMRLLGLEYREVTDHLIGEKSRDEMVVDLRRGIGRLARRQLTWFRGLPRRGIPVTWIAPGDVEAILDGSGPDQPPA